MLVSRYLNLRSIASFILALVLLVALYELVTANATSDRLTSLGSFALNEVVVSDVSYVIDDDGNPSTLDKVMLDILPSGESSLPAEVFVQVVSTGDTWFDCTAVNSTRWLCDTSSMVVRVADIDKLSVVAATGMEWSMSW